MKRSLHCSCFMVLLLGITSFLITPNSSALSYQDRVDVQFTFNPSISLSVSGDLIIDNLAPGSSSDSNIIDVTVNSNNITGYVLTATAGNTSHADTDLTQSGVTNKFTSIATNASLASLTTDDTWGYSFSSDTGSTWTNYSGLPLYTSASGAELASVNTNATTPIKFKIAAKASTTQVSGTYTNVVNFIAVANPEPQLEPVSCSPGHICYQPNALSGVEGTMADQDARQFDASSCLFSDNISLCIDDEGDPMDTYTLPRLDVAAEKVMLHPSNFSRPGYGFAGWSDVYDYETNPNAHFYGPQEDFSVPSNILENGLSLYAVWIKSVGSIQTKATQICNNLTTAPINGAANLSSVSALTDQRDGQTYTIAKLADGKCWMIENLRLENTATTGAVNISLSQGYDTSFVGLANPEANFVQYSIAANSLYSVDGSTTITISGDNQGSRFPRYNNTNTQQRVANADNPIANIYSYGNYYTWPAVVADTTNIVPTNQENITTSICPTGWRAPTASTQPTGEFQQLDVSLGGTGESQSTRDATNRWRKFPNNMVFSAGASSINSAVYWSSTASYIDSRVFSIHDYVVTPGPIAADRSSGNSVRCIKIIE